MLYVIPTKCSFVEPFQLSVENNNTKVRNSNPLRTICGRLPTHTTVLTSFRESAFFYFRTAVTLYIPSNSLVCFLHQTLFPNQVSYVSEIIMTNRCCFSYKCLNSIFNISDKKMPFGQLVFGHPGAGKTTYCKGLAEYLRSIGRNVIIVNLDPANENLPYEAKIDIRDLVDHKTVMQEESLGPNGAFLFSLEYLMSNKDWLGEEVTKDTRSYYLFDCPGQVELYTSHDAFRNVVVFLQREAHVQLCAVHLVDSINCRTGPHYISALLMSLHTMLNLELPHVNILTKIDLLKNYELDFGLDFYTEVHNLEHLITSMSTQKNFPARFSKLNEALVSLIEDFPHVSFHTMCIDQIESVKEIMSNIDQANGYSFQPFQNQHNSTAKLAATAAQTLESNYLDRFITQND